MKKKLIKIISSKKVIFFFAFLLMMIYLLPLKDLIGGSGDASETWKVTKTFFDHNPESSYVMYKGFFTFFPTIISYQLSLLLHLNEYLILKIYNGLSFAYITSIGLPFLFSYVFNKKIEVFKIYTLVVILFCALHLHFSFISVDFASLMVLILAINSFIKISQAKKPIPILFYLYSGLMFALCLQFSGQYLPAAFSIFLFLLISKIIPYIKKNNIQKKVIPIILCFLVGFFIIGIANTAFVKERVQPVRDAGGWLPTGGQWFQAALSGRMLMSKYPTMIPDNRGHAILLEANADIDGISKGGSLTYKEYAKLIIKHPVDFVNRWLNRLFLGISVDNDKTSFIYLLFLYSLLFLSLLTLKKNITKVKNLFNRKTLIILAFVTASLVPCLYCVEMRYFMAIQSLIACTAIFSDTFWDGAKEFKMYLKNLFSNKKQILKKITNTNINYNIIVYIIFIALCFMLFSTQYELLGTRNEILYRF